MLKRVYHEVLEDHFSHEGNMAFLAGPRQSGKTTTAEHFHGPNISYWNWDDADDRVFLRASPRRFLEEVERRDPRKTILVLDEIHKNTKWRGWLKGFYDKHKDRYRIIVTGSARLDLFRRGGDSLLGRYYLYRHHPLSLAELEGAAFSNQLFRAPKLIKEGVFSRLLRFGGFPAPFIAARETSHAKWLRTRKDLLLREDLRDLSRVEDVAAVELLVKLLQTRVGGLLNYQNLANDLSSSVDSVRRWIRLLETLYYCYRIYPYTKDIKRSLRKTPKPFLWDWSEVPDKSARFENFIASHLLKFTHYWTDCGRGELTLFYIRDKEKREVDFLVIKDVTPFLLVECKLGNEGISPHLRHFNAVLRPQFSCQVVRNMKPEGVGIQTIAPCSAISAVDFCSSLV